MEQNNDSEAQYLKDAHRSENKGKVRPFLLTLSIEFQDNADGR